MQALKKDVCVCWGGGGVEMDHKAGREGLMSHGWVGKGEARECILQLDSFTHLFQPPGNT